MGKRRWGVQIIWCVFWVKLGCWKGGWIFGGKDLEEVNVLEYGAFIVGWKISDGQLCVASSL